MTMKEEQRSEATSGVPIPQFMLETTASIKASKGTDDMRQLTGLSSRERMLLSKDEAEHMLAEGLPFPQGFPVSKAEEKALKKVRRRIKNKLSAQESRRRKKEYIEGLEKRVRSREKENSELKLKVERTEEKLRAMVDELFALKQNQVISGVDGADPKSEKPNRRYPVTIASISRATQTGTCLQCYMDQLNYSQDINKDSIKDAGANVISSIRRPKSETPQTILIDDDLALEHEALPSIYNGSPKAESVAGYSSKSSESGDGFLYWQLMRTGDGSPKYDPTVLSPTDSYISTIS